MYNFNVFADAISSNFTRLCSMGELYLTGTPKDSLYDMYLQSYPEGTNTMHKVRNEYDCSTCKQFIRNVGNVVTIHNGKLISIWDVEGLQYPFDVVAKTMGEYVRGKPITSIFRTKEGAYGVARSRELLNNTIKVWAHFHAAVPTKYRHSNPAQVIGDCNTAVQVMGRGLTELTPDAIDTVLELISSKSLYRGEEHLPALTGFKALKLGYDTSDNKELFLWGNVHNPAARFKNTVIGTLVADLSQGVELEVAVGSFESKVAPTNYKRTKALITQSMVDDAVKTIEELGLEPSLHRRFAHISDISINEVIYVDNAVRGKMKGNSITSLLMGEVKPTTPNLGQPIPISIGDFISDVVPGAKSIGLLFEDQHIGNLVSLTAPIDVDAPPLFRWGNNLAWSYRGNITDSIKERVKAAGGNVTAPFRVSLAWYNHDDLDIHVHEPSGSHIYFAHKWGQGISTGRLDVDSNYMDNNLSRTPVENVCWHKSMDGTYLVRVHNYHKRESIDVGFTLEVESVGSIYRFHYPLPVDRAEYIDSLYITVKGGKVDNIKAMAGIRSGDPTREEWGIKTQSMVRVDSIILSPNYWVEDQVNGNKGNKHWFFILEGCINPGPTRGIYNEFLAPYLYKHRKVFEVLGDKAKAQPSEDQLSGLGFSSTRGDTVKVQVHTHSSMKCYEINFNT